jgi:hydrogenase expression/formation protein HypE
MQNDHWITLAHGNGGRFMRDLIDTVFAQHLGNPDLDVTADAVPLFLEGEVMFTTDGFTVQPLEFPGGDIGKLAVHGTANDLAVAGATPRYLSLSAIIEEGLEISQLVRIVTSLAAAAREAQVQIVAGDTKVVPRGYGGGLYLTTTGIGLRTNKYALGLGYIQSGDRILVSGPIGDHGVCVMLAREEFGLQGSLQSDCACVLPLTQTLLDLAGVRFMRDPTRGGLATVAHEIIRATVFAVRLFETAIPVRDPVRSVCEMLGYDPYYLACEGRVVAVVTEDAAQQALARWKALPQGEAAAIIGSVETTPSAAVILETELGGQRFLEELEDDPLPRIC